MLNVIMPMVATANMNPLDCRRSSASAEQNRERKSRRTQHTMLALVWRCPNGTYIAFALCFNRAMPAASRDPYAQQRTTRRKANGSTSTPNT